MPKRNRQTKKEKASLAKKVNNLFPDIPINLFILVPLAVGFSVGVLFTDNIGIGLVIGMGLSVISYYGSRFLPKASEPISLKYTPDDLVLNIFDRYWFTSAEPFDPIIRPEAYSQDGLRWSHKLVLTTDTGDTDIFVVRGSLVTGESYLESVPNESSQPPEYWMREEENQGNEEGNQSLEEIISSGKEEGNRHKELYEEVASILNSVEFDNEKSENGNGVVESSTRYQEDDENR